MIKSFDGAYRFLSNFWPCTIEYEGLIYPSTEAAFQASKTLLITEREKFRYLSPGKAKQKGKTVKLRDDWNDIRNRVMEDLLRLKFHDNVLKAQLLDTGDDELIEGNTWNDKYWGMVLENGELVGENHLGKLLMKVREELKEVSWKK